LSGGRSSSSNRHEARAFIGSSSSDGALVVHLLPSRAAPAASRPRPRPPSTGRAGPPRAAGAFLTVRRGLTHVVRARGAQPGTRALPTLYGPTARGGMHSPPRPRPRHPPHLLPVDAVEHLDRGGQRGRLREQRRRLCQKRKHCHGRGARGEQSGEGAGARGSERVWGGGARLAWCVVCLCLCAYKECE